MNKFVIIALIALAAQAKLIKKNERRVLLQQTDDGETPGYERWSIDADWYCRYEGEARQCAMFDEAGEEWHVITGDVTYWENLEESEEPEWVADLENGTGEGWIETQYP